MKYYVQEIAKNYLRNVVEEPTSIKVHSNYLNGQSEEEFFEGYKALLHLTRSLYEGVTNDPAGFGMPLIEAHEINPKSIEYTKSHDGFRRAPHLLLALGAAGRLGEDLTLTMTGKDFNAAAKTLKITKAPELLSKLEEFGFEIKGLNKLIKDADEITISFPDCRPLTAVLHAMARAQLAIGGGDLRRYNEFFYTMMHEVLASDPAKEPKYSFETIRRALNEKNGEIAEMFNDCINKQTKLKLKTQGLMRNSWSPIYSGAKTKRVLLTLRTEQESLSVKLNLEGIGGYMNEVTKLPVSLRDVIRDNGWACGNCNGRCGGGFDFEMDGTKHSKCRASAFVFTDPTKDDAECLKSLLELEMKREM